MYIERRHRHFLARHDIPSKLWPTFGGQKRFSQRLKNADAAKAEIEAKELEVNWLRQIDRARHGLPPEPPQASPAPNGSAFDAATWRKWLRGAKGPHERTERESHIIEAVEDHMGLSTWQELEEPGNEQEREKFADLMALATGDTVPFLEHLEEYVATLEIQPKTLAEKKRRLEMLGERWATTDKVDTAAVQNLIHERARAGDARLTVQKYISDLKLYWKHLVNVGSARGTIRFDELTMAGTKPKKKKPYPPEALVQMEAKARARGDVQLADFILVGMYTGARAEEIVTLKAPHIDLAKMAIDMPGTKTDAAPREVPIHADLLPVLRRLVEAADGGYIFSGLTMDKFGDRHAALTQAFLRFKETEGFGDLYDWHSVRRTVCDIFQDAGAPENIVASIVGHKVKTLSYGLYAGAPKLATKAEVMKLLRYPTT